MRHLRALFAGQDLLGVFPRIAVERLPQRLQLAQLQNRRIEHHDCVPRRAAHNAVDCQRKNGLERAHGVFRCLAEDGVDRNLGNGGVVLRNAVERDLQKRHVHADIAPPHGAAGVGLLQILHGRVRHKLHVLPVIGAQNVDGVCAVLRQILRPPLAQARTRDRHAVAEFCRQRLDKALLPQIIREQLVDQLGDIFIDVAAIDKFLVNGRRGRDIEGIPPAAVILGVDPIERERDDRQRVGPQRGRLPRRVDLAGQDVFHIVGKRHGNIFRVRIRRTEMNGDAFGDVRGDRRQKAPSFTDPAPAMGCRIPASARSCPAASASG